MVKLNMDVLKNSSDYIPQESNTSGSTSLVETSSQAPAKRKRGRPRKDEQQKVEVLDINGNSASAPMYQTNDPYEDSYDDTNNMLRTSIMQIDILTNDVKGEIDNIKKSKTLKGKYKYMSDLCATASSLVSTKLSAIKEINSTITNCHKLEMQRFKDNKMLQQNQQNDEKYIADLYNAYINTPINAGNRQQTFLGVNSSTTAGNINTLMSGIDIGNNNEDQNFQSYIQNMTPEQNRMLNGDNPNIETVVVYDPDTGDKGFDVIDTTTGTPVANYPRPDNTLLDDTIIDFQTGIASNSNIGMNWKVVVIGDMINKF